MEELEPGGPIEEFIAHELHRIADFIERCPEIVVPGDMMATIVAASEVIDEIAMQEFEADQCL